jgi:hypothetical protein
LPVLLLIGVAGRGDQRVERLTAKIGIG